MPGLYATAYGLRFALKARGVEGKVGPLEGLWWTTDGVTYEEALLDAARESWRWTLMIALPPEATAEEVALHLEPPGPGCTPRSRPVFGPRCSPKGRARS